MKSTKTIAVGLLTFASTFSSHADEFSRWTWRNPKPLGSTLYSIIHAENQFVAVGAYGEIVTSTNGRTWTIEAAGTTGRFLGVCHGDGLFAAYGFVQNPQGSPAFLANLVVSPDARNWTRPPHNLPSGLQGMAYGASHWVCLDTFGNIRSSPDLAGWTLQVPAVISAFSELIFAQDKFVAVGNRGVIMTSTNGITWQEQDSGTTANLQDIAYGDGKFVVVGGDEMLGQGIILTSENAEDWWIQTTDFPLNGVAYGPNGFTAVGGGGFGTDCGSSMNSSDGVYFAAGPEGCDSGLTATPNDVACNDEVCVAVGFWGLLAVSEDGLIWSNNQEGTAAATLHATATTDAALVAVGGPSALLTANDGQTFTYRAVPGIWRAVATDGTGFVAVGEDGVLADSVDGADWQFLASPTTSDLYGVAHGPAGWLAGGAGGVLIRKAPGEGWQTVAPLGSVTLRRLRYSARLNCYVALGDQGTLALSTTGLEWQARSPSTTAGLYDFAESPGRFVVISSTQLFISSDATTWTAVAGAAPKPVSLTYGNGLFVLGASTPKTLFVSADGLTWQDRSVGAQYLTGLNFFKGSFYAVGGGGMILQSASASVPEFLSITPGGGALDFELFGEIGRDYELQSSTNLVSWDYEQDYTQSARQHPLTLPTGPGQRFYRVKLKEP